MEMEVAPPAVSTKVVEYLQSLGFEPALVDKDSSKHNIGSNNNSSSITAAEADEAARAGGGSSGNNSSKVQVVNKSAYLVYQHSSWPRREGKFEDSYPHPREDPDGLFSPVWISAARRVASAAVWSRIKAGGGRPDPPDPNNNDTDTNNNNSGNPTDTSMKQANKLALGGAGTPLY